MNPSPSTWVSASGVTRWPVLPRSGSSRTFSNTVTCRLSPGASVSDPTRAAELNASLKPKRGCCAVTCVTRGVTGTTKALPGASPALARSSRLFGPDRGSPQAATNATTVNSTTGVTADLPVKRTARLPLR